MKNSAGRSLALAIAENAEVVYDFLIQNEAVKAVPIFSTAVRLLEGADDIRSRLLKAKISRFVTEPCLIRSAESGEMFEKLRDDEKFSESVGETLFLTLEKVPDLQKPKILARLFASYLCGNIDRDALLALTHSVDVSSIVDLEKFIIRENAAAPDRTGWKVRLAASGLMMGIIHGEVGDTKMVYFISGLGEQFLKAILLES